MPNDTTGPAEDLRIRRTLKLLSESFLSLMEEKPFEEINVIDICDRAMVHRTTFYKHFEDKNHLLKYCIQNVQDSIKLVCLATYDEKNPRLYYLNIIKQALHYFVEHKRMLILLLNQGRSETVLNIFHNMVSRDILQKLAEETKKGISFRVPVPLITEYHIGALISLCIWWIKNSMPYSEEKMIEYIEALLNLKDIIVQQ